MKKDAVQDTLKILLEHKDNQIEYCKNQIEILKDEKDKLVETLKDEKLNKNLILKDGIKNIDVYNDLNNLIINAIEKVKQQTIKLLDTGKPRIAVIEDDKDIAETLKLSLDKSGFDTYTFDNVGKATKFYFKNAFHLTLLDLNLQSTGHIDGEEFIDILKQFRKETPIIIVSGESDERLNQAVKKTGAICYFKKPVDMQKLIDKIKDCISL